MDNKWRIVIDLSYENKDTCIQEFERVFEAMKAGKYRKQWSGSRNNFFGVNGPSIERLSDEEITKLRMLLK